MKPIALPKDLLAAWRDAVTRLAKMPRGTNKKDLTEDQLLYKVMRQEMGGIHELWETFTQERDQLTKHLLASKQQMVRYLLGFHLPNAARMQLALHNLNSRFPIGRLLSSGRTIRWNDLGCGSGAAAQAAIHFAIKAGMKPRQLDLHLTDASGLLLDTAREIILASMNLIDPGDAEDNSYVDFRMNTHRIPVEKLKLAPLAHGADRDMISVYSMAYVWNELERNKPGRDKIKEVFAQHLRRDEAALLIFLEPANQNFTRSLMELRDDLVGAGYAPLYPCPKAGPCPMLERARDWCYSEGLWYRPPFVTRLDKELGTDRSKLSVAIYAFGTPALMAMADRTMERKAAETLQVVVGRPDKVAAGAKGKTGQKKPTPKTAAKTTVKTHTKAGPQKPTAEPPAPTFDYLLCDGERLTKSSATGDQAKTAKVPGIFFRLRGETFKA
jgi:hypothetical protein